MLSALVITKNEEAAIERCLSALNFADERVVIDCGSTDATCEIARACGARVIHNPWPSYGAQRNFGRDQCRGDWILAIDADEEVSPKLAEEIQAKLRRGPDHPVYAFRRREVFFGKPLRFGASSAYVSRLYQRGFRWSTAPVHESLELGGYRPGRLPGVLLHYTCRDLNHFVARQAHYAILKAQQLQARGRPVTLATAAFHSAWSFFRHVLVKGGVLDGWRGVVYAALAANYDLLAYAQAVELHSGVSVQSKYFPHSNRGGRGIAGGTHSEPVEGKLRH